MPTLSFPRTTVPTNAGGVAHDRAFGEETPAADAPRRPRLAVVIGSGGVRSIAGLGLIDVLRRQGLAPDVVVGCSAGAIFGALAAGGHEVEAAVAMATRLWTAEITRVPRRGAIAQMALPKVTGFGPDFALRCDKLVMDRLTQAFGEMTLQQLPTPLRVTATDADSGETVALTQGRIVDALRASVALPFMFAPHEVQGRRLIDGFLTDPLPVGAALDADVIIALGLEAPMPRRIDRPTRLLAQVTSTMTNSLMHARIAAARGAGARVVMLMPQPEQRVGLFDTEAMPGLVALGRREAEAALPAITDAIAQADHRARVEAMPGGRALERVA
jgi:NTE family protein